MPEPIIEVKNLLKRFGSFTAVDRVSLSVAKGSLFGLLGANGAGKTTLIRMLCGLMKADSGTISLAGIDVLGNPEEVKKRIGYMSQRFSLYRDLTADENLEFFGGLYTVKNTATAAGRYRILDSVGLSGMEKTLAGDLPGGISQRLALACAMSHRPAVLFLDEPTAGVDPSSRRLFWDLIHELAEEGTTVVVTTHYLDEAEYCNDIVLMHNGRIVAAGGPEELKRENVRGMVFEISGNGVSSLEAVLSAEPWVEELSLFGDSIHIQVETGLDADHVRSRIPGDFRIEGIPPSLEDVFLRVIDQSGSGGVVK